MPKPAFYKPPPRWHFFAALSAALALELGAVAVAGLHRSREIPIEVAGDFAAEGIVTEAPPEPDQPPDDPPPSLGPLPPNDATDFVIIEPPPPAKAERTTIRPRPVGPKANLGRPGPASFPAPGERMIFAPRPGYPYEARRAKQTGSGKFLLAFDQAGEVVAVTIVQSTGSALLDQVSTSVFRRWKCRPGSYAEVLVPVTFTLEGARL